MEHCTAMVAVHFISLSCQVSKLEFENSKSGQILMACQIGKLENSKSGQLLMALRRACRSSASASAAASSCVAATALAGAALLLGAAAICSRVSPAISVITCILIPMVPKRLIDNNSDNYINANSSISGALKPGPPGETRPVLHVPTSS